MRIRVKAIYPNAQLGVITAADCDLGPIPKYPYRKMAIASCAPLI
jgi:hypothetical protein